MTEVFETRAIAFVDLLGFSAALESPTDEEVQSILELQWMMQQHVGDYVVRPVGNSTYIRPAFSAFSDNFLISMPVKAGDWQDAAGAITTISGPIFRLAREALGRGFLIRGGICIGDLYHSQGIAFGRGLVRAAQIEESEAIYPRIVLDRTASDALGFATGTFAFTDSDGTICLDYLQFLMMAPLNVPSTQTEGLTALVEWPDEFATLAQIQANRPKNTGSVRAAQNWAWFLKDVQRAKTKLAPQTEHWRSELAKAQTALGA